MIVQEVMIVVTERESLRAEIYGWSQEDPSLVKEGHIGRTGRPMPPELPGCVLKAMHLGWHLLAPPQPFQETLHNEETDEPYETTHYEWWLVREKEV